MTNLNLALSSAIRQCYQGSREHFSNIYPFTTENISGYIDFFNLNNKKLLTVGSSGDQVLNAILNGCNDITVLDVNKYTQYYYFLKVAAILYMNYDDFLTFFRYSCFCSGSGYNNSSFDNLIFDKFKNILKEIDLDSFEFWNTLFKLFDGIQIRRLLFSSDEYPDYRLKRVNPYLSSSISFNKLKDKVENVRPSFIVSRIEDFHSSSKYDNIWLSNICQYISIEQLKKVVFNLDNNLTDDGKMMFGYLYAYNILKNTTEKDYLYNVESIKELFSNGLVGAYQFESVTQGEYDAILTYKLKKTNNNK